jgi:sugar (pentulose or hexulose) kinase
VYIGIDIGTQSIKGVLIQSDGTLLYKVSIHLAYDYCKSSDLESEPVKIHEQNPHEWKEAVDVIIHKMTEKFPESKKILKEICITGTSGTIIPVGMYGEYLFPAIMYDDERSRAEAEEINQIIRSRNYSHPLTFTTYFSLPKILWLKRHEDLVYQKTTIFCHVPDYIIGYLTGSFEISDYSSALKTGYLLTEKKWPEFIHKDLGISPEKLPKIQALGLLVASLSNESMQKYGFERPVAVITGCTDSTAKTIAAGLKEVGEVMISFGSSLVVRFISSHQKVDIENAYSHYHPNQLWISGASSNVSLQWITEKFLCQNLDMKQLEEDARNHLPTSDCYVYPLENKGERFPFIDNQFRGFEIGNFDSLAKKYAAYMEGTCFVARLCLEKLCGLTYKRTIKRLVIIGQNTSSDLWMQLCANILGMKIEIPLYPEASYGAALLAAASGTYYQDINLAIEKCVKIDRIFEPKEKMHTLYSQKYNEFCSLIEKHRKK